MRVSTSIATVANCVDHPGQNHGYFQKRKDVPDGQIAIFSIILSSDPAVEQIAVIPHFTTRVAAR